MEKLGWTGERMVNDAFLAKGIVEHLHRYALSTEFVNDKIVLDIACGEGYGSNLLSKKAKRVIGIDIAPDVIEHARKKYPKDNLTFLQGSVTNIQIDDNSIDVIVSFETIEHLIEQEKMLAEFKRVLKKNGILIISTPEKYNYKKIDPNNPYHLKELTLQEFKSLLHGFFQNINLLHQKFIYSSQIFSTDFKSDNHIEYSGSFETVNRGLLKDDYYFNIAICSDYDNKFILDYSVFNGNEIMEAYQKKISETPDIVANYIKSSRTYRVGEQVLFPFRIIKKIFKRFLS